MYMHAHTCSDVARLMEVRARANDLQEELRNVILHRMEHETDPQDLLFDAALKLVDEVRIFLLH